MPISYHVQLKNSTMEFGGVNVEDDVDDADVFGVMGVLGVGVDGFHSNFSRDPSAFGAKYNSFFVFVGLAKISTGSSSKLMYPSPMPASFQDDFTTLALSTPPIGDGLRLGY